MEATVAASPPEQLDQLRAEFPHWCIWQETSLRWRAQPRDPASTVRLAADSPEELAEQIEARERQ
jgi:hypothetical protein